MNGLFWSVKTFLLWQMTPFHAWPSVNFASIRLLQVKRSGTFSTRKKNNATFMSRNKNEKYLYFHEHNKNKNILQHKHYKITPTTIVWPLVGIACVFTGIYLVYYKLICCQPKISLWKNLCKKKKKYFHIFIIQIIK